MTNGDRIHKAMTHEDRLMYPQLLPLEPTRKERIALEEFQPSSLPQGTIDAEQVDGPLKSYVERCSAWHAEWEAYAKHRPLSYDMESNRVRMFDGRWINPRLAFDVTADLDGSKYRYLVMQTYAELASKSDIEKCRKLANAIYEYIDMTERAQRLLVGTVRELTRDQETV